MNRIKRPVVFLLAAALFLALAGCGKQPAPELTGEETLYNGYLGLTVHLPGGWHETGLNRQNLTAYLSDSETLDQLELIPYEDGGQYAELLSLESAPEQESPEHIVLSLYAEYFPDGEFDQPEDYIYAAGYFAVNRTDDGTSGELLLSESVPLGGIQFTRLTVRVTSEEEDASLLEEYYIARIGELYLVAYLNYWEDSPAAMDAAHAALREMISLSGEKQVTPPGSARETTYYNSYFGISATIPADQYTRTVNSANFTLTPEGSETFERFEMGSYNDGGYYMDFMTLRQNLDGSEEHYAELDLYAESYPNYAGIVEYLDAMEQAFLSNEMTSILRTLDRRDSVMLDGKEFQRLTLSATDPDTGKTRQEEHYVARIDDFYVIAYISYDGETSYEAALNMLELVKFSR